MRSIGSLKGPTRPTGPPSALRSRNSAPRLTSNGTSGLATFDSPNLVDFKPTRTALQPREPTRTDGVDHDLIVLLREGPADARVSRTRSGDQLRSSAAMTNRSSLPQTITTSYSSRDSTTSHSALLGASNGYRPAQRMETIPSAAVPARTVLHKGRVPDPYALPASDEEDGMHDTVAALPQTTAQSAGEPRTGSTTTTSAAWPLASGMAPPHDDYTSHTDAPVGLPLRSAVPTELHRLNTTFSRTSSGSVGAPARPGPDGTAHPTSANRVVYTPSDIRANNAKAGLPLSNARDASNVQARPIATKAPASTSVVTKAQRKETAGTAGKSSKKGFWKRLF